MSLPSAAALRAQRACLKPGARRPAARRLAALAPRAGTAAASPPALLVKALLGPPRAPHTRQPRQQEDTWSLEDVAFEGWKRDEAKEQGRRHLQELSNFTFQRWAFHRSSSRYLRHMSGVFQSRIVRGLSQPLLSAGGVALAVCLYEQLLQDGVLPKGMPSLIMPSLPFDITSFALSLLLVFRTNSSYDRWQQAVTAWSDLATRSRDTLRQLLAYSGTGAGTAGAAAGTPAAGVQAAAATGRWLVALSRSLKAQLTEDSDLKAELQGVLTALEIELLLGAYHRPSFALAVLSELAAATPVRESQRIRLDENLTFFEGVVSRCEALLRTPIPLSYTRHTSRFMVIWLACLPLGLWRYCGWGTVPLTVVISFLLLGIEEIGVAIEEPFSILPLEEMCRELEFGMADVLEQGAASKRAAKQAAATAARQAARAAAACSHCGGSGSSGGGRRSGGAATGAAARAARPAAAARRSTAGAKAAAAAASAGAAEPAVPVAATAKPSAAAAAGPAKPDPSAAASKPAGAAPVAAPPSVHAYQQPPPPGAVVNGVAPFLPSGPGTRGLLGRRRPAPTAPSARSVDAIFKSVDDGDC